MKKNAITDYKIPGMENFHKMNKEDIGKYAECAALAYKDYPLFKYIVQDKYNYEVIKTIMESSIYSMENQVVGFSNSKSADAIVVLAPPKYTGAKTIPFLLGGGIKLTFLVPISTFLRLLTYENYSMELKKNHTNHDSWYLYNLTVRPEFQGKGYCSSLLKPIWKYFDRTGQDCYLETHKEENVKLYEHFGFDLVEVSNIPKTKVKHYSMLRKSKQINRE